MNLPAADRPMPADVRRSEREREPVLGRRAGIVEVRRHHADDRVRNAVDENALADRIAAPRVLPFPQAVAEDDDVVLSHNGVLIDEAGADGRRDAQGA